MPNISPKPLHPGDLVLVINPSGKVDSKKFLLGCKFLESKGFHVEVGRFALSDHFKFAATHKERLEDLQCAFDHPDARAIFCGRGGFGLTHIVDDVEWKGFKSNPKWVVGYSDITVLHHALYNQGYCSIHGPVLQNLHHHKEEDVNTLIDLLKGKESSVLSNEPLQRLRKLSTEIIGGNLSMIVNQIGTSTEIDFEGKILFVEEVGEYLYHIDRMFLQLKRSGKLDKLKALLVGEFIGMKESKDVYGQDVKDIINYHCEPYNYPIIFDFPAGHGDRNMPFVHGGFYTKS